MGLFEQCGLLGSDGSVHQLAPAHVSPFVVRPVTGAWICRTTAAGLAADLGAFQERAGAQVLDSPQSPPNAFDALARLLDDRLWSARHATLLFRVCR